MAYKLTTTQCHKILNDDYEEVFKERLGILQRELELSNNERDMYRIQGRISELREIKELYDKSLTQLENNRKFDNLLT